MDKTKTDTLSDFLRVAGGLREISLAIAKDEAEISSFAKAMDRFDFKRLPSILEYQNANHSWYVVIDGQSQYKGVYDFICQYPLTIVSLYDAKNSKAVTINPDYKKSIVFLTTEEILKDIQKTGFDLLGRVGPVYRSE